MCKNHAQDKTRLCGIPGADQFWHRSPESFAGCAVLLFSIHQDIEVSKLCVGCMGFGQAGTMHDWTLDEQQSEAAIRRALDLGINFFDTANGYSARTSGEYLGGYSKRILPETRWCSSPKCILTKAAYRKRQFCRRSTAA